MIACLDGGGSSPYKRGDDIHCIKPWFSGKDDREVCFLARDALGDPRLTESPPKDLREAVIRGEEAMTRVLEESQRVYDRGGGAKWTLLLFIYWSRRTKNTIFEWSF